MDNKLSQADLDVLLNKLSLDNSESTRYQVANEINKRVGENRVNRSNKLTNNILKSILFENNHKIRSESIEIIQMLYDDYLDLISNTITKNKDKLNYPEILKKWVQSDYDIIKLVGLHCIQEQYDSQLIENELVGLINHPNPDIKKKAIYQCGEIGHNKYTDNIKKSLNSNNLEVVETSIDSLVKINSKSAFEVLLSYAYDKEYIKYEYLLKNIGQFGRLDAFGSILYGYNHGESDIKKASIHSSIYLIVNSENSHYTRQTVSKYFKQDDIKFLLPIIDSNNTKIMRNATWLASELTSEIKDKHIIKKFVSCIDCGDSTTQNIVKFSLSRSDHSDKVIKYLENYIRNNDLDSESLKYADYIRNKLNSNKVEDHKKEQIKYKQISKPEEYTQMKRKEKSEDQSKDI